jgi:hypothetical protein
MIDTKLIDILPDEIPDEVAYHLVNFMVELALTLESHYFSQLRRYDRNREDERHEENWR